MNASIALEVAPACGHVLHHRLVDALAASHPLQLLQRNAVPLAEVKQVPTMVETHLGTITVVDGIVALPFVTEALVISHSVDAVFFRQIASDSLGESVVVAIEIIPRSPSPAKDSQAVQPSGFPAAAVDFRYHRPVDMVVYQPLPREVQQDMPVCVVAVAPYDVAALQVVFFTGLRAVDIGTGVARSIAVEEILARVAIGSRSGEGFGDSLCRVGPEVKNLGQHLLGPLHLGQPCLVQ